MCNLPISLEANFSNVNNGFLIAFNQFSASLGNLSVICNLFKAANNTLLPAANDLTYSTAS